MLFGVVVRWHYGQRNGYGVAVFADGTMYEGSWVRLVAKL
jgi:hypothetical protein